MEEPHSFEEEKNQKAQDPATAFIHKHLDKFALEQPSVLFTADIMQKILAQSTRKALRPLLSKPFRWLVAFFWLCLLCLTLLLWGQQSTPSNKALQVPALPFEEILTAYLPADALSLALLIALPFAVVGLWRLDHWLKRRFSIRKEI